MFGLNCEWLFLELMEPAERNTYKLKIKIQPVLKGVKREGEKKPIHNRSGNEGLKSFAPSQCP
jgi:hypothetical protein